MRIALNFRHKNERLDEALQESGHEVIYNLWDTREIIANKVDAVIFEFKLILKEELRFLNFSLKLKKAHIPRATWCLDIPNIGARRWKISAILNLGLVDIFASHSLQGLKDSKAKVLYLPNAAWISRYNLRNMRIEDLRNPDVYKTDVSFVGNINAIKCPEHRHRAEFLKALEIMFKKNKISYSFLDSSDLSVDSQVDLIQKSRINLNYGCGADRYEIKSWGLTERCYGIPACGGFLLSDERVHAKDDFIEDEEIVLFKDINDCLEKIKSYLTNNDRRRSVAEKAFSRVMREHTYKHRAEKLIAEIKKIQNAEDI